MATASDVDPSPREERPTAYRQWEPWGGDEEDRARERAFKPLSREAAQALREQQPSISPWRVVGGQGLVGLVVALVCASLFGSAAGWSALYGAAVVVVPAALMARGMTSRLSALAPAVSAVSFMAWEFAKIIVSVLMLALAPKILGAMSWPALLAGLIVCIKVYWVALLWRGSKKH